MSCNYTTISNFGSSDSAMSNPLSYCAVSGLDSAFSHTLGANSSIMGPGSAQCELFMGSYCANNWDGVCEYMSYDTDRAYPNTVQGCNGPSGSCMGPGIGNASTKGQILIRNAAAEKYLRYMSNNCRREYQPFDPTVADSPLISRWVPGGNGCSSGNCNSNNKCIGVYAVDPKTIDSDPVMNKILVQPWIAMDILVNIYNNAVRTGEIKGLVNTKLYRLFSSENFQQIVANKMYNVL